MYALRLVPYRFLQEEPFQSAPACERATPRVNASDRSTVFQSAPACERATSRRSELRNRRWCFNPRPRASGRPTANAGRPSTAVSIRARVRAGDTRRPRSRPLAGHVSIRARVRAGDTSLRMAIAYACFNPRPRASGRRRPCKCLATSYGVSIRARVRAGDLTRDLALHGTWEVSIRARVRAGDALPERAWCGFTLFQSAPACERATSRSVRDLPNSWFQSAPACERATPWTRACSIHIVSIRARVRAGDARRAVTAERHGTFQSAPACERATAHVQRSAHGRSFNPRPRASGRRES